MTPVALSVALLIVSTAIGIFACIQLWCRGRDGMRLRLWLMIDFLVAYQASGFAHVLRLSKSRGYYEALAGVPSGSSGGVVQSSLCTLLATLALWAGLTLGSGRSGGQQPSVDGYSYPERRPRATLAYGLIITAVSGAALVKVISVAKAMAASRIIAVAGGNARYVFLAGWFPFGVGLSILALWDRRQAPRSELRNISLLLAGIGTIGASEAWSGGRSALVFNCFPLLALLLPRLKRSTRVAMVPVGIIVVGLYVWVQTVTRTQSIGTSSVDAWGILDWQWGRFSMTSWAWYFAHHYGFQHGGTYLSGLVVVPLSLAHFAGVNIPDPWTPVVGLTGKYFLGSADQIYIVPGSVAELFVNFSYGGVIIGYLIMGRLAAWLADTFESRGGEARKLMIAYAGSVMLSQVVFQFEAFFQDLIMAAGPLWVIVALESRKNRVREASFHSADG